MGKTIQSRSRVDKRGKKKKKHADEPPSGVVSERRGRRREADVKSG